MRAEAQAHIDQINAATELLRRFLDCQPIHAHPVSRLDRARKWVARHSTVVCLALVAIAAVGTTIGLGFWSAYQEAALDLAAKQKKISQMQLEAATAESERQRFNAVLEHVRQRRHDTRAIPSDHREHVPMCHEDLSAESIRRRKSRRHRRR